MVDIYCDTGDLEVIRKFAWDERISGFTTNPSLMKKSGITRYMDFAHQAVSLCLDKPISLEVLADDFETMEDQARKLGSLWSGVFVKIPITNTSGESTKPLIEKLSSLKLNITAVMTKEQIADILPVCKSHHIISVFNGRITDTQELPLTPQNVKGPRFLWASARHVGSVREASFAGYDIITLTPELIAKLPLAGKNLKDYSLETVRQFYEDGKGIEF